MRTHALKDADQWIASLSRSQKHTLNHDLEEHHYVSLDGGECPFDGAKLLPVEDIVDEIVEIAQLHGASALILEQRPDLLGAYREIAAVRYRWLEKTTWHESEREQEQNV